MVEIFKTNVDGLQAAQALVVKLSAHLPGYKLNIDLHDCDKILRAEGKLIEVEKVIKLVTASGCFCQLLH